MTYDDFKSLCKNRRSIRYFDDKPIAKNDVIKLLELAQMAPSVENLQPWHFHVIFNKELRHTLAETSCYGNFVEGAGVFIIVTANRSLVNAAVEPLWNEKELDYSCMGAMMNILYGATAMAIGSCWVSLYRGNVHEILKLPPHEIVVGGIMLGHYKKGEDKSANGQERGPMEEIYTMHE